MIEIMLPQLWGGAYAMPGLAARDALPAFFDEFIAPVEIVTELRSKLGSGSVSPPIPAGTGQAACETSNRCNDIGHSQRWYSPCLPLTIGRSDHFKHVCRLM